ncbi:hypothetical protein C8J57DRAFT_1720522 [Mycena rebaudengoi]|nr:hypothetical protein C8J57DRAFT_1720522 [Mycena rebaudengoi]
MPFGSLLWDAADHNHTSFLAQHNQDSLPPTDLFDTDGDAGVVDTTTASAPAPRSSLNRVSPNYAPQNNNSLRDALGRVTAIASAVAGFFSTSVRRLFGAPPTDPE